MTTHVSNITIAHAPVVNLADEKAVKTAEKTGVHDVKTVNAGERFDPAAVGLTDAQVAQMVARGQIREATDKDPPVGAPAPMKVAGNETEGSGATRRGTSQIAPPGVDAAATVKQ